MKRTTVIVAMVAVALVAAAGSAFATAGRNVESTSSDVAWFADPEAAVGTSRLVRADDSVLATLRTSGLAPGDAVTLWWVVFNDPSGCSHACGEDDIFINGDPTQGFNEGGIAAADIVVGYADGAVVAPDGRVTLAGSVAEEGAVREIVFGAAPLLKDVNAAEIHLVVRSHGPALSELLREQLGSYAGGCEVFLHPPEIPGADGECADVQFAIHLP